MGRTTKYVYIEQRETNLPSENNMHWFMPLICKLFFEPALFCGLFEVGSLFVYVLVLFETSHSSFFLSHHCSKMTSESTLFIVK